MSKRKGMSAEEKKSKVHEVFMESQDVFQLKEVEKAASKNKGVNSMLVKEIVQSLCDDGMVDFEKIGSSNYYWSFASKVVNVKRQRLDGLRAQAADLEKKLKDVDAQLEQYNISDEEAAQRVKELAELDALKAENDKLKKELLKYRDCDPAVLKQQKEDIEVALESANRWTDNVMSLMSYCKKNFNIEENQFTEMFGVPKDFDYLE